MTQLEGQPLSAIVAKIGAPIEERTIEGKKVYIWGSPNRTPPSRDATCEIRATMNGDIVGSLEYQGDEKLCERYAGAAAAVIRRGACLDENGFTRRHRRA